MQIPTELDKFACQTCSTKIAIADLEQIFLRDLHAFAQKHAEALAGLLNAELADDHLDRERRNVELELQAVEMQITAGQQSVLDLQMRPDAFSKLLQPLTAKRLNLQNQAKKLQRQKSQRELTQQAKADAPDFSADELIEVHWPRFAFSTQQKIARIIIDHYVVTTGHVVIHSRVTSSLLTAAVTQHLESLAPLPTDDPEPIPGEPLYIRLPKPGQQCPHCGLTRSKLNELILATPRNHFRPPVKSLNSCPPGKERGVRLIIWASLKAYLHSLE